MFSRHLIRLLKKHTFTNFKACKVSALLNQKHSFCVNDSSLKYYASISYLNSVVFERTYSSDFKTEADVQFKDASLSDSKNISHDEEDVQKTSSLEIDSHTVSSVTENVTTAQKPEEQNDFMPSVVYMRGLPYSITKDEIIQFFDSLGIEPSKITLRSDRFGNSNGKAEVEFETSEDATKALKKHNQYIGNRYIELSLEAFPQMNADRMFLRQRGYNEYKDPFSDGMSSGYTVKLNGLPYETSAEDIHKFFENLNIKPIEINLKYSSNGQPLGLSFVKFKTKEEASEALKNNNEYIGNRYIKVTLVRSGQGRMQYSGVMYNDQRNVGRVSDGIKSFEG